MHGEPSQLHANCTPQTADNSQPAVAADVHTVIYLQASMQPECYVCAPIWQGRRLP